MAVRYPYKVSLKATLLSDSPVAMSREDGSRWDSGRLRSNSYFANQYWLISGHHGLNGSGSSMTGAVWRRASVCTNRFSSSSESSLSLLPTNCPQMIAGSGGEKLRRRLTDLRKRGLIFMVCCSIPIYRDCALDSRGATSRNASSRRAGVNPENSEMTSF